VSVKTNFILSYKNLLKLINLDLKPDSLPKTLNIDRESFLAMLRATLRGINVHEEWYRRTYADVDAAIKSGRYRSAKQHFVENGYFEGRRPGPILVDENWYKAEYPDIAEGIELGDIASAQAHFDDHGYEEGRLPSDY
jgi:hypothetical protein